MATIKGNIKKIQLSNGDVYAIFDEGSLHLSDPTSEGRILLLSGNPVVDDIILQGGLEIDLVNDVPITESNPEVVFRDPTTGQILKLDLQGAKQRLGILHYSLEQTNGVLRLDSISPENWV